MFKYCRTEHMRSMLTRGAVRIGSLSDYRRQEAHGAMVSDDQEGIKPIAGYVQDLRSENVHQYPAIARLNMIAPGTVIRHFQVINSVEESPELLIFSMSTKYSAESHRKWRDQEGYDACYRIDNLSGFLDAITLALGSRVSRHYRAEHVSYISGEDIAAPTSGRHPAFVKRPDGYTDQCEFRTAWRPTPLCPKGPVQIPYSLAGQYCVAHASC